MKITKERIAALRESAKKAKRWWASTVPSGQHDEYKGEAIPKFCNEVAHLLNDLENEMEIERLADEMRGVPPIGDDLASNKGDIVDVRIDTEAVTKTRPAPRKHK